VLVVVRKTAAASAHHAQRDQRAAYSLSSHAGGAATNSASNIPAANHEAKAGGRVCVLTSPGSPHAASGR